MKECEFNNLGHIIIKRDTAIGHCTDESGKAICPYSSGLGGDGTCSVCFSKIRCPDKVWISKIDYKELTSKKVMYGE